jgi:phosphoribosylglycinamide formyltransferase-1
VSDRNKKKIAIFASGRGTNLENILKQIRRGKLHAETVLVFSDNPKAPALRRAKRYGVPFKVLEPNLFATKDDFEREVLKILRAAKIDCLILAGYMRILGPILVRAFKNRILNIHPALLPSFRGRAAIEDTFHYGVKVTGVTVHFVDEKIDHGPIILQRMVPVEAGDTLKRLEQKVHAAEYELYPRAIRLLLSGKLKIKGRKVLISNESKD